MTMTPITLRNLTAQPLTIKLVERYEAPNPKDFPPNAGLGPAANATANITSGVANLTSGLTNLLSNVVGNGNNSSKPKDSSPKASPAPSRRASRADVPLSQSAQSFAKQEVDIRIEPFTTKKTDINTTERGPNDVLRLTLEGDGGGRWRIDTSITSTASKDLSAIHNDPKHNYSAVYLPSSSFLAISETTDLPKWMSHLADHVPLSALSIPGTHNSPTYYKALPSVRCQAHSPVEQLNNGVRFFDIRVQPSQPEDKSDEGLNLVHGVFPISLTGSKKFRPLVKEIQQFLAANPSETVILSIKREGAGESTDKQLGEILKDHYTNPKQWYTEPRIPNLGEVRGRIVLMRRFELSGRLKGEWNGTGWCLNANDWAYNTANHTAGDICVQDFCEVMEKENIDKKIQLCCDHFERAAGIKCAVEPEGGDKKDKPKPPPFHLNFLSASNFWNVGCWPEAIAAKLNPACVAFLCEKHDVGDRGADGMGEACEGDGQVGIVVCDWVGRDDNWDLVRCIVGMNARLLLRDKGIGWK
jgi:1-phosphatidylinositol phosphodiesterase